MQLFLWLHFVTILFLTIEAHEKNYRVFSLIFHIFGVQQMLKWGTLIGNNDFIRLSEIIGNCYSCTATEAGSNCERNPISVDNGVLSCNREARTCTIVRVEEWPSRRVKSFYRGCDGRTRVFERNHCIVEKDERTCFTACDGDLCNASDGLDADREFLRYDSVVPPVSSAAGSSSIGCKRVFNTVNAVLMTFPLWVM